ncbi:MAG: hypothetical protein HZR80_07870 [Candidatus Heimdallarchaeota archaeon]
MNNDCKGKPKHKCGEFKGNEDKEAKLKHLKECREDLLEKVDEIDQAIKKLEE